MKEVTEWNGKPRFMWVWDDGENLKDKKYVVCILTEEEMLETGRDYPVRALDSAFKHCAEIEEETTRLTNYELSQLLKCLGVVMTPNKGYSCSQTHPYFTSCENMQCHDEVKIRYAQGEWQEPTRETVLEWWRREVQDNDIAKFISFFGWDKE